MDRHRLLNQQIIKLPHKQDGSLNYGVLGNMLTATILGEVLEVSFIDHDFGKPEDQLLPDIESEWELSHKENDIAVYKKRRLHSKTHCFLGRGVVEAPFRTVVDYIHKLQSRLEWDDFLMQIEICKVVSENDWLYYMAHEATQCLFTSKRDFFIYLRTGYVDNKYIQTGISIEDKDYPHRPPYVRGEVLEGSGWVVEKYKGSECTTLLTYVVNMDLKELPSSLMDKVLKRQPMAIHHIRKKLTLHPLVPSIPLPPTPDQDSDEEPLTSSDGNIPNVEVSSMFEDAVPINHYLTVKEENNESIYTDPDVPMYPWVTDKQAMAKKKLSREQMGKHFGDKMPQNDNVTKYVINEGDKPSAWLPSQPLSTDTERTTSPVTEPAYQRLNVESDVLTENPSQTNVEEREESVLPRKEFPSFSAWCKDEN